MAIQGYDPQKCYFTKRSGTFCGLQSIIVFDAGPDGAGACTQHVGQVCLQAMGRGQDLTTDLLWPVTAVPADQWDEYERVRQGSSR